MATTTVHSTNEVTQFESSFRTEYLRFNQFAPYMGSTDEAVIRVDRKLQTTTGGEVSLPLVQQLVEDDGIVGNALLEGNEEAVKNFGQLVRCEFHRKAAITSKREKQRTAIDLMKAKRSVLMGWKLALLRNKVINQMSSITAASTPDKTTGSLYSAATATELNQYNVANADRLMYGDAIGNFVSGNHAGSLANITAAMTMTGASLSILKRRALSAGTGADSTRITPIRVKQDNNEEWMVCFMPTNVFRDFKDDPPVLQAQRDAEKRGRNNPMFRGGDLIWDGIIVREVKEIPDLSDTGAAGVALAPVHLCGKVAMHVAYAQDAKFPTEQRDYGFFTGVACELDFAVRKGCWQTNDGGSIFVDYGMATAYLPSVPDA